MHNNLVILAGGASSRMKKRGSYKHLNKDEILQINQRSKALITVDSNNRPILDYLLYNAKQAGYKNIYIVISEKGSLFKQFYGKNQKDNNFHELNISFAVQYIPKDRIKPFGTADALLQAVEQYPELNTGFYSVCNSDNLYSSRALGALRMTDSPNAFISYDRDALDFTSKRIASFAIVKLDSENHLLNIIEKPATIERDNYKDIGGKIRVSMNIFKLDGKLLYKYLKNCPVSHRNEKELPIALSNMLIDHPKTVIGIPFSEHVPDLTSKDDITIVKEYLKKNYPSLNWNDKSNKIETLKSLKQ